MTVPFDCLMPSSACADAVVAAQYRFVASIDRPDVMVQEQGEAPLVAQVLSTESLVPEDPVPVSIKR